MGRHFCSCPDRRPRRSRPRHAPRRGSRVGRIGRSPRARRRLTHAPAGSPTTASKPSRAGKGCLERPHSLTAGAAGSARPAPLRPRPRSECLPQNSFNVQPPGSDLLSTMVERTGPGHSTVGGKICLNLWSVPPQARDVPPLLVHTLRHQPACTSLRTRPSVNG